MERSRQPKSLVEHLEAGLRLEPTRTAFDDGVVRLTYREVDERSQAIAAGLQRLGLRQGAAAAVYSPNDAMAFVCVIGAFRAGAAWNPANVRNALDSNAAFLELCECTCLFFHSTLETEARTLAVRVPSLRWLICLDRKVDWSRATDLDTLIALGAKADGPMPDPAPADPDCIVAVVPTGGTTGRPKAVQLTNRIWDTAIHAFWECLPLETPGKFLVAGPMTHAAGAVGFMMFNHAPTFVVLPKPDPISIMEAIDAHGITHMYLPPTMVNMIVEHPRVREFDFSALRYLVVAASPIAPEKLRQAMQVFGSAICQSYGQAEAMMFLTFLSNADLREARAEGQPDRFASCGRATREMQVEIMDDDGQILAPGVRGEIVARGPLVFPGYYKNAEATAAVSAHGWHHTGDVGFKDEDGFFYIVDRKKDMVITGGFNVFTVEVEQAILSHPAVRECAVIGIPDDKWGEAIKAVVELKDGQTASAEEIQQIVRSQLGGVHTPKSVEFWAALPRSTNGKIAKNEVRNKYWQGRERAVS